MFLRRSKRCGCRPDLPTFNEILEDCDDRLFHKLCSNTGHLLPPPTTASQLYNTISDVLQHVTDSYQHAQATSPTATSSHVYCTKIVTELLSQCDFLLLLFTRPIYTVTAMRFVTC